MVSVVRRALRLERQLALVPSGGVLVNEAFARRAIEERGSRKLLGWRGLRVLGLLERSPQGGTLRTVAHGRRARLTHVLLGGSDIWHERTLRKSVNFAAFAKGGT